MCIMNHLLYAFYLKKKLFFLLKCAHFKGKNKTKRKIQQEINRGRYNNDGSNKIDKKKNKTKGSTGYHNNS